MAPAAGTVPWVLRSMGMSSGTWIEHYNTERTHEGKICRGRTPFATMLAGKGIWDGKVAVAALN